MLAAVSVTEAGTFNVWFVCAPVYCVVFVPSLMLTCVALMSVCDDWLVRMLTV